MIICFLGTHIHPSRLFIFVCLFFLLVLVQSNLIVAADANSTSTNKRPNRLPYKTKITTRIITTTTTTTTVLAKTNNETNTTGKCEAEVIDESLYYFSVGYRVFAGALVVPITICAICGNILVIYVIRRYPSLRITGNVFLASLAVADVGVSTLAMTFYGLQLLYGRWLFGAFMCRLWFSCDVLFSTASIIHLACISLDRYLSIVRPFEYERSSSELRRYIMIFACWFVSALLSFIPIFTGLYTTREQRLKIDCLNHEHGRCIFAVNQAYAIVSSSFSFWVPGAIMIIMYAMLIRIADKKEREMYRMMDAVVQRRRASQQQYAASHRQSLDDQAHGDINQSINRNNTVAAAAAAARAAASNGHSNKLLRQGKHDSLDAEINRQPSIDMSGGFFEPRNSQMKHLKRERRAVKTLGSVMVAFIICWLPFFVRYTACEPDRCNWKIGPLIADIVFWVGYFNSMINPFLYAFHNREFRVAFEKTLRRYCVCCRKRRESISSISGIPATPSGDFQRTNMKRLKTNPYLLSTNSITDRQSLNPNHLSLGNTTLDASNGNLTTRNNSFSLKRNSCL